VKRLFILLVAVITSFTGFSQSCLPDGITFHTQADIDSFQVNYPGCSVIEGDVFIGDYGGGSDIYDLSGLNVLDSVRGNFLIRYCDSLADLSGLENLKSVGDQLGIVYNPLLKNLEGLEGVHQVYYLGISFNENLVNLTGLENLETIGYGCHFNNNPSLTSLTGLEGLTSTGCGLSIASNPALLSLDGLDNLESTGCGLSIEYNFALQNIDALSKLVHINTGPGTHNLNLTDNIALTSISGLRNIDPESIEDLLIGWNLALSDCDAYSICQYLADPNGYVAIRYNSQGCNTLQEVLNDCANNCLLDGITFTTQSQIDNFPAFYPDCTEIGGDVTISGDDITNLLGLSAITSIGGYLSIAQNDNLESLTGLSGLTGIGSLIISSNSSLNNLIGLDGLTSLQGSLAIYGNSNLTSLGGLNNLVSIKGNLEIGGNNSLQTMTGLDSLTNIDGTYDVYYNAVLIDLTGIESLTSIGGDLAVQNNSALASLTALENLNSVRGRILISYNNALTALWGLENIDAGSVTDLFISSNETLSSCNARSICEYLASPNGSPEIHFNAPGCNNTGEVEAACGVGVGEPPDGGRQSAVRIYPNPSTGIINVELSGMFALENTHISIQNLNGQVLLSQNVVEATTVIDVASLPLGFYFVKVMDGRTVRVGKFVKQ
jgi:hypothetical protein